METTYRVLIKGIQPNTDANTVRENIAKLFNISYDDAARVLGLRTHVVKGGLVMGKATQYHTSIKAAGAICVVEPETQSEFFGPSVTSEGTEPISENTAHKGQDKYRASTLDSDASPDSMEPKLHSLNADKNTKECDTCKKTISVLASACPACGAPNEWIHPDIQSLISNKDATGISKPFTFQWNKAEVWGETKLRLPWWAWLIFILTAPISFEWSEKPVHKNATGSLIFK